ncbi:uncharacterized protein LACBIDRAFT_306017 [Laccaria bicolor S238N-H82]|uniref:Predicted protein n=1 Tax=Laccaria bicolor (strain S238N-H82 / ATCC MYA-4686) TaxID=486041 RepID=B0CSI4_LACBS|nr:uncharacterized protein LACBIDRAFT_306017 [Laccaria bicolor S238N-H82]EDR14849.1 predicted protein [Laccaria bicolor S238N-H82]|eukprot:XP_001875408.1 predicted protein [Laccaria bicolor S238N-H82]
MLGLDDYGSDHSDGESPVDVAVPPPPKRAPKKLAIKLPTLSTLPSKDQDEIPEERPTKRPRLGAGSSSLLSMLPVPKKGTPNTLPQRVLGGGTGPGLVFNTGRSTQRETDESTVEPDFKDVNTSPPTSNVSESESSRPSLLPPSLLKRKANISLDSTQARSVSSASSTPPVDFFSLGSTSSSNATSAYAKPTLPKFSAAPSLPTFEPPEPTPTDPYPGYYQLPSGAWAAYEPEYYAKISTKWQNEYDAHVRALEKGTVRGFEGLQNAAVEEIDALKEMEKAKKEIKEREDRKAITKGAGEEVAAAPRMNINASKTSGIARSRHQLSTLLREAYENREALEEKIAEGRRNRKEAGNKYGF